MPHCGWALRRFGRSSKNGAPVPSWLISPLISFALFALVSGAALYEKHAYDERRRAEGRAELLPQLEADKKAFDQITASMLTIKANAERIKKSVDVAQKANAARVGKETTRVATIEAISPKGETECERTDDAITKALR